MDDQPEKFDLNSLELADEKREELLRLFPEVRTEGDKIDFEKLKLALGEAVEVGKERFGMNWPGKADCFRTIQVPSVGTLRPCPEESINFDTTRNLLIEGENLEVLKLLQKSYLGKIKMIYIDPPYNTGNDFIYPDNFTESLKIYLEYTGQVDAEGRIFGTNSNSDGRFHSKWMNMMFTRLYIAKNLLRDDGIVFISIDDTELFNLKEICDQIFGEENFLGNAVRVAKKSNNKGEFWAPNFDYILTYARDRTATVPFLGGINVAAYNQIETEGPRKGEKYQLVRLYMSSIKNQNPEQRFWIECPDGSKVIPPGSTFPPERPLYGDGIWRWTKKKFDTERENIVIKKVEKSNLINENHEPALWNVYTKTYLNDVIENASAKPNNLIEEHINQIGTTEVGDLGIPFDYPKPSSLIKHLLKISQTSNNDIILDFFAGSGTTAHAVLDLNKEDENCRKFILVQLPEPLDVNNKDQKAGAEFCDSLGKPHNLCEITKERVRRVIKKLNNDDSGKLNLNGKKNQDRGFRVFKLAESNFKPWNSDIIPDTKELGRRLELHINHIRDGRIEDDILYEILLKSGFPLTTSIEKLTIADKMVHSVSDGALFVCLEKEMTLDLIRGMAEKEPQRIVCLDEGFNGSDQLKANAVQIFKTKGIPSFKTI